MKSLIPILVLLISLTACNSKSHEPVVSAEVQNKSVQTQLHGEIQDKYQTWDKEPTSVFGIPFGASKKEVAKQFNLYGCHISSIMEICQFNHKLSTVNLICTVAFSSKSGMQHVRAMFSEYDSEIVFGVLSRAYGRPHFTIRDADDPGKIWAHDWRGKNVTVSIVGESFSITTKQFFKEIEESKKKQISSGANQL